MSNDDHKVDRDLGGFVPFSAVDAPLRFGSVPAFQPQARVCRNGHELPAGASWCKACEDWQAGQGFRSVIGADGKMQPAIMDAVAPVRDGGMRWADDPRAVGTPTQEQIAREAAERRQAEEQAIAEAQAADQALHDQFAGQALATTLSVALKSVEGSNLAYDIDVAVKAAYNVADAMMRERAKRAIERAQGGQS